VSFKISDSAIAIYPASDISVPLSEIDCTLHGTYSAGTAAGLLPLLVRPPGTVSRTLSATWTPPRSGSWQNILTFPLASYYRPCRIMGTSIDDAIWHLLIDIDINIIYTTIHGVTWYVHSALMKINNNFDGCANETRVLTEWRIESNEFYHKRQRRRICCQSISKSIRLC